jgi:hypothetical protein
MFSLSIKPAPIKALGSGPRSARACYSSLDQPNKVIAVTMLDGLDYSRAA